MNAAQLFASERATQPTANSSPTSRDSRRVPEDRDVVTPASIRVSMPPIKDVVFENLRRFQLSLLRVMTKRKDEGCYQAEFLVESRDLDEHMLNTIFDKLVASLRHEKFFVVVHKSTPRTLIVSWDPIVTQDSITTEERNNPQSNASIRLRSFEYLRLKEQRALQDEALQRTRYDEYNRLAKQIGGDGALVSAAPNPTASKYSMRDNVDTNHVKTRLRPAEGAAEDMLLQIQPDARQRAAFNAQLLNISRNDMAHQSAHSPGKFPDWYVPRTGVESMVERADAFAGATHVGSDAESSFAAANSASFRHDTSAIHDEHRAVMEEVEEADEDSEEFA